MACALRASGIATLIVDRDYSKVLARADHALVRQKGQVVLQCRARPTRWRRAWICRGIWGFEGLCGLRLREMGLQPLPNKRMKLSIQE